MRQIFKSEKLYIVILLVFSAILRFINLGYSEFQGDEIRALYLSGSSFPALLSFILEQKKGPLQFITTYLIRFINPYFGELVTRLPFAIAGLISILILYLIVKELYGKKVAFVSAFLFSFNGFFVAFSRIVQYQSLTYLFYLLAIYFVILLHKKDKIIFLFLSGVSLALSTLSHYDAVFVSLICLYFFLKWFIKTKNPRKVVFSLTAFFVTFILILSFYGPFFISENFSGNTKSYLFSRIFGEEASVKETNTKITYELYNPLFSIYFLFAFAVVGIILGRFKLLPIYLWFILPFIMLNFLTSVPGTHIYNYVLPIIILSAYGVVSLYNKLSIKPVKILFIMFNCLFIALFFYQSFMIFVDHEPEYPYFDKKILFAEVGLPPKKYHLSVFGFPYNRKLSSINSYIQGRKDIASLVSNENSKIIRYYVNPLPVKTISTSRLYIYVYGAQSLATTKNAVASNREPDVVFYRGKTPLSEVYLIPDKIK